MLGISACSLGYAFSLIQLCLQPTVIAAFCGPDGVHILHTFHVQGITYRPYYYYIPTTEMQQKHKYVLDIFLQEIYQTYANADIITNLYDHY